MPKPRGRQFFANPGPTNIPDCVLRAMDRPSLDFNDSEFPDTVATVLMAEGHDAEALRNTVRERFNVSLGGGLGKLGGRVFRFGHLGDLNEPMLLGALAAVEMGLSTQGVPHGQGGVDAAMEYLAASGPT